MSFLTTLFLSLFLTTGHPVWQTDFSKAKVEAKENRKYILLNFSGSDWCIPCIKMHKTLFESEAFESYAENQLVLVNADFPRLSKNKLSEQQQKQNEALAEQYNMEGAFPFTVLLNTDGKTLKAWDGVPDETPEEFVKDINNVIGAGK